MVSGARVGEVGSRLGEVQGIRGRVTCPPHCSAWDHTTGGGGESSARSALSTVHSPPLVQYLHPPSMPCVVRSCARLQERSVARLLNPANIALQCHHSLPHSALSWLHARTVQTPIPLLYLPRVAISLQLPAVLLSTPPLSTCVVFCCALVCCRTVDSPLIVCFYHRYHLGCP